MTDRIQPTIRSNLTPPSPENYLATFQELENTGFISPETMTRLNSYFSRLMEAEVEPERIGLIIEAIRLYAMHNIQIGKPHLIEHLFKPTINPSVEITPSHQDEMFNAANMPLTGLYAFLRDRRNDHWAAEIVTRIRDLTDKGLGSLQVISGGSFSGKSNLVIKTIDELEATTTTETSEIDPAMLEDETAPITETQEIKLPVEVLKFVPDVIGEKFIVARQPYRKIAADKASLHDLIHHPKLQGNLRGKVIVLDEVVFFASPNKNREGDILSDENFIDAYHRRCIELLNFLSRLVEQGAHVITAGIKSDVTSQEFLFYTYLKTLVSQVVVDEHTMVTSLPRYKGQDFEKVLTMKPGERISAMNEVRESWVNRFERRISTKFIGVEYKCAAFYAYPSPFGLVIAAATETTRTGKWFGATDMLYRIILPSRGETNGRKIPKNQQVGARLLDYYSLPQHCSIWYFLMTKHPTLYKLLRDAMEADDNIILTDKVLSILDRSAGEA